ncbi:MAG: ShlB/FhaC/HecB family hemolysin secretion/activation protein, partial [Pseudanabaena sp. SU_2_4]|nr:ShlB/FhaC/HecB family hemolysin secretion/activation protein [Pseudanabaena sp. SU_2_4]
MLRKLFQLNHLHLIWLAPLFLNGATSDAIAQITAPPELTRPGDRPTSPLPSTPPPLPSPSELLKPSPQRTLPSEVLPNVSGTITVEKFEIVGSTVFSPEELEKITNPFTQRPITFTELLQVRTAITQLYIDRGFITSGAFVPLQTIEAGIVKIQVLEGGLEAIEVTGTQRLNPDYVRSRLEIATGKPLNRERLIEALQLLQLDPLIANISAELSAGTKPGQN